MYLVLLVVVLSSTGNCDPTSDHDRRLTTQNDVITQTTIYPSIWSVVNRKCSQNTQTMAKSTGEPPTPSQNVYNKMKTLSTPSTSLKISTNTDSESQEYSMTKVTANVEERTTTLQPEITMTATVCDTDQLAATSNPVHINATAHETHCTLLVNAPNTTAISVSVLDSEINNAFTYFYIELLESQILNNSTKIKLISLDNAPCVMLLQGNQFRFHLQNTKMKVRICNKEVETSVCYGIEHRLTQCKITPYESKIQASKIIFSLFENTSQ